MMAHHNLKINPEFFDKVIKGHKRAELRKNDRNFTIDDILTLKEWDGEKFTGREEQVIITDITDVNDYAPGYVLISILQIPF